MYFVVLTCIPAVPAAGPGNLSTEGGEEVEESPRLDDNVRHGCVCNHDLGCIANA